MDIAAKSSTVEFEKYAGVVVVELYGTIVRGKRKSKRDQRFHAMPGDVLVIGVPESKVPKVINLGPLEQVLYHPGNLITRRGWGKGEKGRQIVYQDRWFTIYTTPGIMQESLKGMIKAGVDVSGQIPLMERLVISRAYAGDITDEDGRAWARYMKLRELFLRPGTLGEGAAAKAMGVKLLKGLAMRTLNDGRPRAW